MDSENDNQDTSVVPESVAKEFDPKQKIEEYFDEIPDKLKDYPEIQEKCLKLLSDAEESLARPDIIQTRLLLLQIEIEMRRATSQRFSFIIVASIVYLFGIAAFVAGYFDLLPAGVTAEELNQELFMGIPTPIWLWSVIGSLTSMLVRAGYYPFSHRTEAIRWMFFRPVVGVVTGLLTYLMLTAGLIVFTGTSTTTTPELLWVIAFVGSFSDTLSIQLLQRIMGRLATTEETGGSQQQSGDQVSSPDGQQLPAVSPQSG